ncbi:MAG: hypothetical protein ABL984_06965 [Pyrinomonadaceae bacterium]
MRFAASNEVPAGILRSGISICLLIAVFSLFSCTVPNLESPACTESKNAVREFYSYHFGNEMKSSAEGIKRREKFLTPELAKAAAASAEGTDPFTTGSDDIPKTFRVGDCREISPERTESSVLLFWRSDDRTEQREIKVEAIDKNDTWLVNKVSR